MLYSCFNPKLRLYEVFEDDRGHPMNGDLPVPTFGSEAGNIGVPASEAGRRLPQSAKRVGTSWHARGLVVQCNNVPVRGLGHDESPKWSWKSLLVTVGVIGGAIWFVAREDR